MEINIKKLKNEITKYNKTIEKYEETIYNLYHQLNNSSSYWIDNLSNRFFTNIATEKKDISEIINNLKEVNDIYKYILNKYEQFGEKIKYDFEYQSEINSAFDKVIIEIDSLIKKYNNLNLSFGPTEKQQILNQKENIILVKNNIEDLKEKINKTFQEIEEIEREVNKKISQINITIIKESNVSDFV